MNHKNRLNRLNLLKTKKGSLVLSFLASGVVAVTIVAAHQTTRRFVVGAGQGMGYQSAFNLAQEALGLASLMVTRNVVLCKEGKHKASQYSVESPRVLETGGCAKPEASSIDPTAREFFAEYLKLEPSHFSYEKDENNNFISPYVLELDIDSIDSKSPFYEFLKKGGEIKWSLTNWKQDSSISTIFSALGQGMCRDTTTFKPLEEGICDATIIEQTASEPQKILCKDSNGNPLENGGVCDYSSWADNDSYAVFITVSIPYVESSEGGATGSQRMVINGAVRRPIAIVSLLNGNSGNPVCSVRCEASEIVTDIEGLEKKPPCAGISDYGADVIENLPAIPNNLDAHSSLVEVPYNFIVKNHGPGVIHDLEFYREDHRRTAERAYGDNTKLSEEVVPAGGGSEVKIFPTSTLPVQDTIPCYDTSYYRLSVDQNSCGSCNCIGPMFPENVQ